MGTRHYLVGNFSNEEGNAKDDAQQMMDFIFNLLISQ